MTMPTRIISPGRRQRIREAGEFRGKGVVWVDEEGAARRPSDEQRVVMKEWAGYVQFVATGQATIKDHKEKVSACDPKGVPSGAKQDEEACTRRSVTNTIRREICHQICQISKKWGIGSTGSTKGKKENNAKDQDDANFVAAKVFDAYDQAYIDVKIATQHNSTKEWRDSVWNDMIRKN